MNQQEILNYVEDEANLRSRELFYQLLATINTDTETKAFGFIPMTRKDRIKGWLGFSDRVADEVQQHQGLSVAIPPKPYFEKMAVDDVINSYLVCDHKKSFSLIPKWVTAAIAQEVLGLRSSWLLNVKKGTPEEQDSVIAMVLLALYLTLEE